MGPPGAAAAAAADADVPPPRAGNSSACFRNGGWYAPEPEPEPEREEDGPGPPIPCCAMTRLERHLCGLVLSFWRMWVGVRMLGYGSGPCPQHDALQSP